MKNKLPSAPGVPTMPESGKGQNGFTLIEMMITVVVIAILSAIAIPSYTQYVVRGKLVEAQSTLADFRVKMEQYYQDNRNYGPGAAGGTTCGLANPSGKYFSYACSLGSTAAGAADPQSYTVTASNKSNVGMGSANAYVYTIDQDNTQQTTAFPGTTASAGAPLSCWISKKGDSC